MRKIVVASVNSNPQYFFYLPLFVWAWKKFGWEVFIYSCGVDRDKMQSLADKYDFMFGRVPEFNGEYKTDTLAQISRLYATCNFYDGYFMTSDIDMLPLSDYWKPDFSKKTVWGHDLTGYGHFPICYLGMMKDDWDKVMMLPHNDCNFSDFIKRDLDSLPQAKSKNPEEVWVCDQDLITMRLKPYNPTIINRGVLPNGYAYGRVDRSAWTLNHNEFIDAHLLRDIWRNEQNFNRTMELLKKVWPDENFQWFEEYKNEFAKLNP